MLRRVRTILALPFTVDRSRYLIGGASLVLMVGALLPWSRGPSEAGSYVGGHHALILSATVHWTEWAARCVAYGAGVLFLGVALGLFPSGPRLTTLGWAVAGFLAAFPCWISQFAPDQAAEKQLLYREMNRVTADMEANYPEQAVDWRAEQFFGLSTIEMNSNALKPERQTWSVSLFDLHRWFEAMETVLGLPHEFFGFFRRMLLALLIVAVTGLLAGLHLRDGRGLAGLGRGVAVGFLFLACWYACALVPKGIGELFLYRAETAWHRGEQAEALDCLRLARAWQPGLVRSWWYRAQVGQLERLQDRQMATDAYLAAAYDELQVCHPELCLEELRRAQLQSPDDANVRRFLAIALSEAGILAFNSGQYSLAGQYWDESVALTPINPMPWYGLYLVHLRLKQFDEAATCLDHVAELYSYFGYQRLTIRAQAYVAKSWAAAQRGDMALAHEMYSLSLRPDGW